MGADQSSNQLGKSLHIGEDAVNSGSTVTATESESTCQSVPSNTSDATNGTKTSSVLKRQLSRMGSLIVVNPGRGLSSEVEEDQMWLRLQRLGEFRPIIENRDKISWSREGEELRRRLDPEPLMRIGLTFQHHLLQSTVAISSKQSDLTQQVKDIEKESGILVKGFMERQKTFAKHTDRMNKLAECSRSLLKCQLVLNECRSTIQTLNAMLPLHERLEPFTWAEDLELVEIRK